MDKKDKVLGPGLGDDAGGPDHAEVDAAIAKWLESSAEVQSRIATMEREVAVARNNLASVERSLESLRALVVQLRSPLPAPVTDAPPAENAK